MDLVVHGERGKAADAVAAFNAATGHSYSESDFVEYSGWRDLDDFAMEAARPAWPKVLGVTPEELAEIVRRIQRSRYERQPAMCIGPTMRGNVGLERPLDTEVLRPGDRPV